MENSEKNEKTRPEHEKTWHNLEESLHDRSFRYSREGWGDIDAKEY